MFIGSQLMVMKMKSKENKEREIKRYFFSILIQICVPGTLKI